MHPAPLPLSLTDADLDAIRAVPGLSMLIALAAFNNVLGGVFMALMDAYGLELVSVEAWGFLWGGLSMGFIVGGLVVARVGLGSTPVKVLVLANLVNWIICSVFTIRSSIVLLAVGTFVWITLMPVIEAAEQTVLQRSIPLERQGRVFGFAQLVENAASPLMAVAIGAGCDFLTPIGHQCNTLVMGPGGYKFGDYSRLGLPLSLLVLVVGVVSLTFFWPLT